MHRFFAEPGQIGEKEIVITGADVNHIRNVLRMRTGEEVLIADGRGAEYRCKLTDLSENEVRAQILWKLDGNAELASAVTLFQGLPKSDKMDLIVQKCVELGVDRIVPVSTKRAVVKLDAKKEETRLKRWNTISESAAKQSGRGVIPEVSGVMSFEKALEEAKKLEVLLIPYERAEHMAETRRVMGEIRPGQSVGVFIGPEGGFDAAEVQLAKQYGATPATLGPRILRTETAPLAALSVLMYITGNMQ